jgi:hypothetical protein
VEESFWKRLWTCHLTDSEHVSIAFIIQHAKMKVLYYTVICGLWFHHIFAHNLINSIIFGGKKLLNRKFLYNYSLKHISFEEEFTEILS